MHQIKVHTIGAENLSVKETKQHVGKKMLNQVAASFVVLLIVYVVFYFLKKQALAYESNYVTFLLILIPSWALGGLLGGKFRIKSHHTLIERLKKHYTSLLISLGAIAIVLFETSFSISRFVVVGSLIATFIIEAAIEYLRVNGTTKKSESSKPKIYYPYLILDLITLNWILFFLYSRKIGFSDLNENHFTMIAGIFVSWIFASLITHQFRPFFKQFNFWKAIGSHIKFLILIVSLISIIVYILQISDNFRSLFLIGTVLYAFWSTLIAVFLFLDKVPQKTDNIRSEFLQAYEINLPEKEAITETIDRRYKFNRTNGNNFDFKNKLELIYFSEFPKVFEFLERKLNLSTFNTDNTFVLRSRDIYNVKVLPDSQIELFVNLHKFNDVRRINEYFIEVNKKLEDGGIYAGSFEPIRYRYKRFLAKYPFLFANLLYLVDFIWHRVTPKIPVIQKVFFAFTKGKNRAISLAEGFGRLYYCGFEILDLKVIDNLCYFVAKKVKEPSSDLNPSYSLIFKMRRLGKNGVPIYVYKIRTMHPYSEYLQEFIYKQNNLEIGGKFKDDFRITKWGIFLRKLWLDELPMIINLVKGNCKLVGVRPLSRHYLSLYDEEFRDKRLIYKPGLIPPYYADLPKTLDEIISSEKKYLENYDETPVKTDFIYFWKSFRNIVFNKARSN